MLAADEGVLRSITTSFPAPEYALGSTDAERERREFVRGKVLIAGGRSSIRQFGNATSRHPASALTSPTRPRPVSGRKTGLSETTYL
jgi:hypothetical protein